LGVVETGCQFTIVQAGLPLLDLPLADLQQAFEQAIPRRMAQAAPPPDH
jgi:hypothetical protein